MAEKNPTVGMMGMQRLQFIVIGDERIHCAGCEQRISNALRRLQGVHQVEASTETQQVVVTIDLAQITPDQVRARLEQLGYEVTSQGASG